MKLTYRGISYQANFTQVEVKETTQVAKYRGLEYCLSTPTTVKVFYPTTALKYRGVAYCLGGSLTELPQYIAKEAQLLAA